MQLHDGSKTSGQKLKRAVYINNTKQIIFMFGTSNKYKLYSEVLFGVNFL